MSDKELSARERDLMAVAWQCFDVEPKINYNRMAELTGMTNPRSAYNAWRAIRTKIDAQAGLVTMNSTPRAVKERVPKRAVSEALDDTAGHETPSKKTKAFKSMKKGCQKLGKSDGNYRAPIKHETDDVPAVWEVDSSFGLGTDEEFH